MVNALVVLTPFSCYRYDISNVTKQTRWILEKKPINLNQFYVRFTT